MNLFKKVLEATKTLSDVIELTILQDNFIIVETEKHTTTLLIKDMHVVIWMANTPKTTRVYSIQKDSESWSSPRMKFKYPKKVRNAIIDFGRGKDKNETEDHY